MGLSESQIDQFTADGFVRLDDAFSEELADAGRTILWRDTGCNPQDPSTWVHPVIRLGDYGEHPFQQAARMEVSGIVKGADKIGGRVKEKKKQTDASKGKLPAFVAVVEFGQPKSVFEKR